MRLRFDATMLREWRAHQQQGAEEPADLKRLYEIVHKLAGASGTFGFDGVSRSASDVEQSIVEIRFGRETLARLDARVRVLEAELGRA
jgi:HPt (histidine-containing phosphotransfer) domain-containing protein